MCNPGLHNERSIQESILARTQEQQSREVQQSLIDSLGWMVLSQTPHPKAAERLFEIVQMGKADHLSFLADTIRTRTDLVPKLLRELNSKDHRHFWADETFPYHFAMAVNESQVKYSSEKRKHWTTQMVDNYNTMMATVWNQSLSGVLTQFWMCGPFANHAGEDRVYPPEQEFVIDQTYGTERGIAKWREVEAGQNGNIDFLKLYNEDQFNHAVVYLMTYLYSIEPQTVSLRYVPFDEGHDIFVNENRVKKTILRVNNGNDAVPVNLNVGLKKGWNTLLVKTKSEIIRPEGSHTLDEPGTRWRQKFEITGGVLDQTVLVSHTKSIAPIPEQRAAYSVAYFEDEIMPILKSSEGREACIHCHQIGGDVLTPMELYVQPQNDTELIYNYNTIVDRINAIEPNRSSILQMPLGGDELNVEHPGGRLFTLDHPDYLKLRSWVMGEQSTAKTEKTSMINIK